VSSTRISGAEATNQSLTARHLRNVIYFPGMAAPIPYLTGRVPAATFRDAAVFAPRQTRTPPLRPPHLRSTTHLRSRTCPPHAPARGRWAARPAENAQRGFALAASPHGSGVEIDTTGSSSFSVEVRCPEKMPQTTH